MVEEKGLFYLLDLSLMKIFIIGGNINENLGGLCGLKYGVICDYVMGFEFVLLNGDIICIGGKLVKDVVGYDLICLFIGFEGIFGVVIEVILKFVFMFEIKKIMFVLYEDINEVVCVVFFIIVNKIILVILEFLD